MTREDSVRFLMLVKLAYPASYKDLDKESKLMTVELWQRVFCKTDLGIMRLALENYVKLNKYPPTVADICDELNTIHCEAKMKCLAYPESDRIQIYRKIAAQTQDFSTQREDCIRIYDCDALLTAPSDQF
jgi:hypothetical protein